MAAAYGPICVRLPGPGPYDARMATPCVPDAAAEANQAIRTFMAERTGRPLWPEEQAQYEQLLAAWAAAVHQA